jgi:hypothetical protein
MNAQTCCDGTRCETYWASIGAVQKCDDKFMYHNDPEMEHDDAAMAMRSESTVSLVLCRSADEKCEQVEEQGPCEEKRRGQKCGRVNREPDYRYRVTL